MRPLFSRLFAAALLLLVADTATRLSAAEDSAASANDPASTNRPAGERLSERERAQAGLPTTGWRRHFRAYEPTEVGYTVDQTDGRDDRFLDATISFMLPIFHSMEVPTAREHRQTNFLRGWSYARARPYFAMTDRFGQFVYTRESSPVVNKRFNPALLMRWWAKERDPANTSDSALESEDNFFEVIYAHESNGQSVDTERQYLAQVAAHLEENSDLEPDEQLRRAHRSARDNISRGWDYVGFQFARDWDPNWNGRFAFRARAHFYIDGLFQGNMEEFNDWEVDPDHPTVRFTGRPERADYDGLTFRVAYVSHTNKPNDDGFDGRCALTYTTGYAQPGRHNTLKFEIGFRFRNVPLLLWVRTGYNSDLIDYYRRDTSFGAKLSFWRF